MNSANKSLQPMPVGRLSSAFAVTSDTPYDPELPVHNQQRHGSWVLQLNPKTD
jgi:hypothetical protein